MTDSLLDSIAPKPEIQRGEGRPDKYLSGSKRVPSSTTICGMLDKPGLIHWANVHGLEGRDLREAREFEKATDIGHFVHEAIRADIHSENSASVPPEFAEAVASALGSWKRWRASVGLEFVATEVPLVSNAHRFGGTLDAIVRDSEGRLAVADWKTSKGIYKDYLIQVASYGLLWNETNLEPVTGGYHIVRFSKSHGDMEYRHFPELADAERAFLLLRELYDIVKELEKRAR